jgi:hypothetical protein
MVIVDDKINDGINMFLRCWPFRWPWRSAGAIQSALPNAACSGLLWKPLDATSGKYLLRIAPAAARATANEMTMEKCTKKTCHFDGRDGASVGYRANCPIEKF